MNLILCEDDTRYRESLEELFAHTPGMRLDASFGSAVEALARLDQLQVSGKAVAWDLALMDLDLPGMTGIEATAAIKKRLPEILVVCLAVFEEPATILEAICAGADGYLLKRSSPQELLAQLRVVASGGARSRRGSPARSSTCCGTPTPAGRAPGGGVPPPRSA